MPARYKVAVMSYVIKGISRTNQEFIYIVTRPEVSVPAYTQTTTLSAIKTLVADKSFASENCLPDEYYNIDLTNIGTLKVDVVDHMGNLASTESHVVLSFIRLL